MIDTPQSHLRRFVAVAMAAGLFGSITAQAADWPHWRGPNGNGITLGNGVFDARTPKLDVAWRRPLGVGYSGISVVEDHVVTMFADGTSEYLVLLEASSGAVNSEARNTTGPRAGTKR